MLDIGTFPLLTAGDVRSSGANAPLHVLSSLCAQVRPKLTRLVSSGTTRIHWQLHPVRSGASYGCNKSDGWFVQPDYSENPTANRADGMTRVNMTVTVSIRSWQDPFILKQQPLQAGSSDTLASSDYNILGGCLLAVAAVFCIQPISVFRFLHDKHVEESSPPHASWLKGSKEAFGNFDSAVPNNSSANSGSERDGQHISDSMEALAQARVQAIEMRNRRM